MPATTRSSFELGQVSSPFGDHVHDLESTVTEREQHNPAPGNDEDTTNMDGDTDAGVSETNQDHRVIFMNLKSPIRHAGNHISTAKYSVIRFLPVFLFEQFRRWANIFFLFIALMQQIPDVSPTGRYTTAVPLLFIFSVSAIKEIIEDVKRHRADDETNNQEIEILKNDVELNQYGNPWIVKKWRHVEVGDIVKVQNNTFFPADLVLISSSEPQGMSFIETANLDGETNLKIRQALPCTSKLTTAIQVGTLKGTIECEPPNKNLYDFTGVLRIKNTPAQPLGPDQILLRGAVLRNTSWVFGIVIYTGHETKLMCNSTAAPLKRSSVDKLTNTQVILLFIILLAMCVICAVFNEYWTRAHIRTDWYIGLSDIWSQNFAYNLLTFIILFNNLIPISLQVTLEVVRFIQAIFINMDKEMYHEETDTPAMARTSNLNEELGQVKYIFSDKTGTLTRNVMEFKKCAVGNIVYTAADGDIVEDNLIVQHLKCDLEAFGHKQSDLIKDLLVLLSVCHTVIPEKFEDGSILYHAASPDERALVNGAKKFGYTFLSRTPDSVEIDALGVVERYEILNVLEFTSTRKRMSVIVRDSAGRIRLFCKGADTVIYERLHEVSSDYSQLLLTQLDYFATEGLRTLVCAVAELDEGNFRRWQVDYHKAATALQNREEKLEEVSLLIEKNLRLIGATAIEDRLQEGVPETIATLLLADISIWVLTGDKQETAINIGYSSRLIANGMQLIILNADSLDDSRNSIAYHKNQLGDRLEMQNEIALIVDGKTLTYALSFELRTDFVKLCISCKVVICCRVSPIQKAEVVQHVTHYTKSVTLAIGDGANDVPMIQKAHVGVGISGMEGLQAACASDYSIAQFRFLLRLLLVHGTWNYSRMSKLILYSFYKNICLYVIELWFAIYSGWSGQVLFERWSIGLYNVFFTALPPLAMGIFDIVCAADTIIQNPKLYKPSQSGSLFNVKVFWIWVFNGMLHAALLYWLTLFVVNHDIVWPTGRDGGYLVMGNFVYTYVVVTVCLKAGLISCSWTWLTHCAIWGSIVLWFLFIFIYSHFWPIIPVGAVMAGMDIMLFTSPVFWLGFILIPLMTVLPDLLCKVVENTIKENEMKKADSNVLNRDPKNSLSETARLLQNVRSVFRRRSHARAELDVELQHGFAFSQEEGGTVSQRDIIRAYNTNIPKPDGM